MRLRPYTAVLLFFAASLLAQTPVTHSSPVGFTIQIPADWEVVDTTATLPSVQQQVAQTAASDEEKKGISCVQVALTARHGAPASVMVVVALPFDCFGQQMTDKDLPGFASGASEGIKNTFDITGPMNSSYSLGAHTVWIERAKGTLKDHPEVQYTVETVCSILKKGAVCWMAMAADDSALKTFEHGTVTLDGEAPSVLVPATAFQRKPS